MTVKSIGVPRYSLVVVIALTLTACATSKRDWQEANRVGTVKAYEQFLEEHPSAEQADDVRRLLPELRANDDWSLAEATNTIRAYYEFLSKHPQSEQAKQAKVAIESLRFEQARANDSIFFYESYLEYHPDGIGGCCRNCEQTTIGA